MGLRWPPRPLKTGPLAVTPSQTLSRSRKAQAPLTSRTPCLVCPHPVTSLCPTPPSQVLFRGGTPRAAPGTWRPWMVFSSSGLALRTCRPSCSGSLMLFRRKGFTSRFLVVSISSGKNFTLKCNEARAPAPFTPKPSCSRPSGSGRLVFATTTAVTLRRGLWPVVGLLFPHQWQTGS
ncbi:Hypothetical predicted protein [Lynx pardinus]|uniref:Uncharacterized protein n=1 Tax=Lynx pardinus TaxID=191816 RepID=A0A485NEB8_LYNPA|nr:Hypothetical predicted protein [Lynx pardinus]